MQSILRPFATAGLACGLVAGSLALPRFGLAQTAPPPTSHPAASAPGTPNMQVMVEQRIKDLHASLHITDAQEPQWTEFAQVMRDNAKDTDALYEARADKIATMTAVENMQSYAAIAQQHATEMQKLLPAFQALYASFSDQQKKQADEAFRSYAQQPPRSRPAKQ